MRFLLVAGLAVLSLWGCPRRPIDFGPYGVVTDPDVAWQAIASRREKVRAVQGDARASVQTPDGRGRVGQFIIAERPDRVRIEALSFFGQPLAVFTTDGEWFALHDLEHGHFYEGAADAESIARLVPLRVRPEELTWILLGLPPEIEGSQPTGIRVDERRREYVLDVRTPRFSYTVGVDPTTLRALWINLPARPGMSPYIAGFADHRPDELDLPRRIHLAGKEAGKVRVELRFTSREVNPELDPEVFVQQLPPGAVHVPGPVRGPPILEREADGAPAR